MCAIRIVLSLSMLIILYTTFIKSKDENKLKAVQELSDNLDLIVANPQYQTFLEHAMRVFIKILQVKVLVRFNLLFSLFSILSISLFQSLSLSLCLFIYLSLSQAHTHNPIIQLLILLLNSVILFFSLKSAI